MIVVMRRLSRALAYLLPGIFLLTGLVAAQAEEPSLRVALTGKYPPFSFYDEQGELAGFDVDVSRAIGARMNRPVEFLPTEWDGILAGLLSGKFDAIIGSMAVTPERAQRVLFSEPYYYSGAQLFIHRRERSEIQGIQDCRGRAVGVVLGETYEHYLRVHHPEVEVKTYKSSVDIFEDLATGRLVGFVSDRLVGAWQIKNADRPFLPMGAMLFREEIAIPVNRDRPELSEQINHALRGLRRDGELDELFDRWFGLGEQGSPGEAARMGDGVIVRKLLKGFAITLGVAALSLLIGFSLAVPCGVVLNLPAGVLPRIARGVVDFIRGTPVLIQLFFVYFGAPQVGLVLSPIASAVLTLSVNAMAYMAEVVRAGLMSVDRGQVLAARALGLTPLQAFRFVVWPQAFRIAIPPLINSVVALTKDTALISIISVGEVIREAQSIISVTFNPMKYYGIVACLFFVVTFPLMRMALRWEARIRERGFVHD